MSSCYLERRKVDNTVNIRMFREYVVESFLVPDVELDAIRPPATDELYAIDGLFRTSCRNCPR